MDLKSFGVTELDSTEMQIDGGDIIIDLRPVLKVPIVIYSPTFS